MTLSPPKGPPPTTISLGFRVSKYALGGNGRAGGGDIHSTGVHFTLLSLYFWVYVRNSHNKKFLEIKNNTALHIFKLSLISIL